jgi:hypothetical protein
MSKIIVTDGLTEEESSDQIDGENNLLRTVFENGVQHNIQTLNEIRERLANA